MGGGAHMMINLNKLHFPVTALGPGRRIGIWFQGCTIGCAGCLSRDTWEARPSHVSSVDAIMDWVSEAAPDGFDGATISGGEPFQQPAALGHLLDRLAAMRSGEHDFDLLAYSGYPLKTLQRRHADILGRLDAIIPGRYIERQAGGGIWRGSRNQEIVALSERGRAVYSAEALQTREDTPRPFQLCVTETAVWYIGVPNAGHMQVIEAAAAKRGIALRGASWRS